MNIETTAFDSAADVPPQAAAHSPWPLRPAQPSDLPEIVAMIAELAAFERLSHLVETTEEGLGLHLFGDRPVAECVVAEAPGGGLAAFALFFTNFSTFKCRPGLYLEDLYVRPAHRGQGLGQALLRHLGALALTRGCGRFEWSVLDWNANAIALYEKMGAAVLPEWRICRVSGEALAAFAPPTGQR